MHFNTVLLSTLLAAIRLANAFDGDGTWYQPNGGYGACGWALYNDDMVVALPSSKYASGVKCQEHIDVHYGSKSVNVVVADLCPGCGPNDVDLSEGAFKKLTGLDAGRIKVKWDFKGGLQAQLPGDQAPVSAKPAGAKSSGDATWYQPNGGFGACGARSSNNDLVVGLPQGHYGGGNKCWRHLNVYYQGTVVDATVVDLCPGCGPNDINLSEGAFRMLAPLDIGRIKVSWEFKA